MTREALRAGLIDQRTIRDCLVLAKGDLFVAASYLGCTARELDGYIRASEELQGYVAAIGTVKADPNYDRMSTDQFVSQLDQLTRAFRVEAINVIHELATMPFDSAAMAEVKLKAAVQLRGTGADAPQAGGQQAVLQELNDLYHQAAPRIKSIRVTQAQIEMD